MNYGHGGDIYAGEEIRLDFSISVNPMGLPAAARERASEALLTAHRYPDPECRGLRRQLSEYYGLSGQWFVFGNGAADVIFELARAVKPGRACLPAPGFSEYERALRSVGCAIDFFELRESEDFRLDAESFFERAKNAQMVFLCNPSNPTGRLEHLEPLAVRLLERGIWLAVDECFLELAEGGKEFSLRQLLGKYDRLCILDGLTKSRAMAGLRLGYAVSANAGLREKIGEQSQPWKVSVVAQEAAEAALGDREYMEESLRMIGAERERVTAALRGMGFKVYPSAANFLLFRDTAASNSGGRPGSLGEALLARGILIRSCGNFRGLDGSYYRIGLKQPQENDILLDALGQIVAERDQARREYPGRTERRRSPLRAKAIMIQGTMSNAGKSLLAAGLCRIFKQDGYRVAPFKSQNMALNSYITDDGLEMGRAQAVQAEAAGVRPSADMNPVLLKPTGDTGSQVIVCGIPIGTMPAREYFTYKKKLIPEIRAAYERLASQYDIIVIEGAGSPAEINLKQDDIVNMGMAKMADAPVLLAGDIDRGGVFAQLYGTVALLEPEERARIKGLIVNKFRGDKTILEPGIRMLEELCGVPVAGVVPYMHVDIEDEDSLSERLLSAPRRGEAGEEKTPPAVRIAVIRFPRLSNFTDFQVLSILDDVEVSYVSSVKELGEPDLVILPGTKNTMEDLLWLRQSGLEAAVLKLAGHQTPVVGICGGYQMLGETLRDPEGTESGTGEPAVLRGMGLLPMETVFHSEKTRTRVSGVFGDLNGPLKPLSGMELEGYEIHMGETGPSVRIGGNHGPLTHIKEQQSQSMVEKSDGFWHNYIYGTYIHGIFDGAGIARALADSLRAAKGLEPAGTEKEPDYRAYREQQYDALAGTLREHLDMEMVYKILRQEETT